VPPLDIDPSKLPPEEALYQSITGEEEVAVIKDVAPGQIVAGEAEPAEGAEGGELTVTESGTRALVTQPEPLASA